MNICECGCGQECNKRFVSGHYLRLYYANGGRSCALGLKKLNPDGTLKHPFKVCICGCKTPTEEGEAVIPGHRSKERHPRWKSEAHNKICACGCGQIKKDPRGKTKKEHQKGVHHPFYGKKHAEESKKKMGEGYRKKYQEHPEMREVVRKRAANTMLGKISKGRPARDLRRMKFMPGIKARFGELWDEEFSKWVNERFQPKPRFVGKFVPFQPDFDQSLVVAIVRNFQREEAQSE